MSEESGHGTPALLVVGQVLQEAAEVVASQEGARTCLKVRSGEHLAAIFLCGLFGCAPSAFDRDGGPDLVFDEYPEKSWFPYASPAVFEIKSLPGSFREQLDLLLRSEASGRRAGLPFPLRLWTAAEVMRDAHPTIVMAERSLSRKMSPDYSRNVFLITHPFDHFAVDVAQSLVVSDLMPKNVGYDSLDSIWVYWPPDKLVMWSKATQVWTDIIFAVNPAVPFADDKLSFIQNVELTYMAAVGINESPYVYNIEFQ
ncbi:hypothetical protein [Trebonia sp.]|uniref:hypothetical protein n=1 Tax=Trebonia sp. TaxID=2767075 RepID=UPI00261CFB54|nr:hypothetical protein [Trebonia sp.]